MKRIVLLLALLLAVYTTASAQIFPHVSSTYPTHNSIDFQVTNNIRIQFDTQMNTNTG